MKNFTTRLFILLQHLLPQHLLSRLVGHLAASHTFWLKNLFINWFVRQYDIDMSQAQEERPTAYRCFNDFFTRELKPGIRPIDSTPGSIVSPADGAISQLGDIDYGRIFQAKGRSYSLTALLGGDSKAAAAFVNGQFATVYLSPRDYHRVHMPLDGTLTRTIYVPGDLFSVNQTTAEGVEHLFSRNERLVAFFDTELGPMAMVMVGAMIVAGIETVWSGIEAPRQKQPVNKLYNQTPEVVVLKKGEEMGRFYLGSTVILLFGPNVMQWQTELSANSPVMLGQQLGTAQQNTV
ncbi:archaetidylserine decarboxylase [Pontibacter sp. JAM-7]|uniref:archaetidylserine decarboxylase n=1 Tax=Pontibacter sp. JAM-7 TaxID=3366581 RepID=UPI003AF95DF6